MRLGSVYLRHLGETYCGFSALLDEKDIDDQYDNDGY
jgi:hypothetical protein